MSRYLDPLLQTLFLFSFGAFLLLCLYKWTGPQTYGTEHEAFCGTVSPAELCSGDLAVQMELGKTIFRNNCAACHAGDMKTNLTGPALGGMTKRWQEHGGRDALYAYIRNSQKMINTGENDRARLLWEEWGPTVMNSFINLTDEDLDAVVSYVETTYYGECFDGREYAVAP